MPASPRCSTALEIRCVAGALIVRFELALLDELGFGLDLEQLRRDRHHRRPRLCLAEDRPRGQPRGRRSLSRPAAAAAAPSCSAGARRRPTGGRPRSAPSRLTGYFLAAPRLSSRAESTAASPSRGPARRTLIAARPGRRLGRQSSPPKSDSAHRPSTSRQPDGNRAAFRATSSHRPAQGAGGALPRLRALDHHAARAARRSATG